VHRAANGRGWKVRFRDHAGQPRSETYSRKADADRRDLEIKLAKEHGGPLREVRRSGQTFEEFAAEWVELDARPRLQKKTLDTYAGFLDRHLIPRIGSEAIAHIDPERVLRFRADLASGGVPDYTSARTLKLLRQILGFAVQLGRIPYNPADVLRGRGQLPSQARKRDVRPLSPDEIETIRRRLTARRSAHGQRDAVLVSLMGYAGLRPQEALGLAWRNVDSDFLRVEFADKDGTLGKTKTSERRTVRPLVRFLIEDLETWRNARDDAPPDGLVFPREDGEPWKEQDWNNWRRVWRSVAPQGAVPYDLRHGHASLLIREGWDVVRVARRMGHSPTETHRTYAHVFDQYEDTPAVSIDALIESARAGDVSSECPSENGSGRSAKETTPESAA
jgi:integrase